MTASLWMLSRKHPPSIGGMQQLSFHLVRELERRRPVTALTWGRSQIGLPWFFLSAFVRVFVGLLRRRIALLHLGDPALAMLGWLPRRCGVPVAVTVHGLDIVHPNRYYQAYLRCFFWGRIDRFLCISRHVAERVLAHGEPQDRVRVIPVGIEQAPAIPPLPADIDRWLGSAFPVLCCLGRLVERKGTAWFLAEVALPWLEKNQQARLLIIGDGPERERVLRLLTATAEKQVKYCGEVTEAQKWALLSRADLLVMPNIAVEGDAEGFGLVTLEAASVGTYVAAARLEGLCDAISDGINGCLIESGDAGAWCAALDKLCSHKETLLALGARARTHVLDNYSWSGVGERYANALAELDRGA